MKLSSYDILVWPGMVWHGLVGMQIDHTYQVLVLSRVVVGEIKYQN